MIDKNKVIEYFDTIEESKEFIEILKEKVSIFLDKSEVDYLCGKRKSILFTNDELESIFKESDEELTNISIQGLIEKGLLNFTQTKNRRCRIYGFISKRL
jgi:hypothetical protein